MEERWYVLFFFLFVTAAAVSSFSVSLLFFFFSVPLSVMVCVVEFTHSFWSNSKSVALVFFLLIYVTFLFFSSEVH